ncbi:hypothetical protein FRB95_006563 [Tulasnella sp. JGI-2019a]|nr:hypothetical protein FRB95_006563 [Tulasnella sp. JGI-2019a]
MVIEVVRGAYVFDKPQPFTKGSRLFKHNPLHDLESVWWLAVWFMVSLSPEAGGHSLQSHLDGYTTMFPKISDLANSRLDFIGLKYHFMRFIYENLPEVFVESLGKLDDIKQQMLGWYEAAYKPFELLEQADSEIFGHAYDRAVEVMESAQVCLTKLPEDTEFITLL